MGNGSWSRRGTPGRCPVKPPGGCHTSWRSYERRSAGLIEATNGLARAEYLIALASDAPLPEVASSIYLNRHGEPAAARSEQKIAHLEARAPAAEAAYTQLLQSTSWRLTAPLQRIIRMFRWSGLAFFGALMP